MNILKCEKPLLVISGATATGKSSVAIEIAKKINSEIISADSMQVYKYMDIGTAKVTKEEREEVKHHLIDVFFPDEEFSVAIFKEMAKKIALDIISRGKVPILAGGTGFYINALVYDNDFKGDSDLEDFEKDYSVRNELEQILNEKGREYLFQILKEIDSESAKTIHPNNVKRVIRAIEFHRETGEKISSHNQTEKQREPFFNAHMVALNADREVLYNRINVRVDTMLAEGLVEEVKKLLEMGYKRDLVSMQGIGYKEIAGYLHGEYGIDEAVEILKQGTRRFAKRQITWFKNKSNPLWVDIMAYKNSQEIAEYILGCA